MVLDCKGSFRRPYIEEQCMRKFPLTYVKVPHYTEDVDDLGNNTKEHTEGGMYTVKPCGDMIILYTVTGAQWETFNHENTHAFLNSAYMPHTVARARVMGKYNKMGEENYRSHNDNLVKTMRKLLDIEEKVRLSKDNEAKEEEFVAKNLHRFRGLGEAIAYNSCKKIPFTDDNNSRDIYGDSVCNSITEVMPHCETISSLMLNEDMTKSFGKRVLSEARNKMKDPIELYKEKTAEYVMGITRFFQVDMPE